MQVRVLFFGVLKDWLGASASTIELPEGASVADLVDHLTSITPAHNLSKALKGIAVSVNSEYATTAHPLSDGDEVGLLPPVSGGAARTANVSDESKQEPQTIITFTRSRIDTEKLVTSAKRGEDGAVVVFDGVVRNNSRGRKTLHLDYEAYEEMAVKQMNQLAAQAREQFNIRHVTIVHRLGRLEIGETSVLIIVASAHRAAAFEACRWIIDTLKKTVPIWKKETFVDGAVWADGEPFPAALSLQPEAARES